MAAFILECGWRRFILAEDYQRPSHLGPRAPTADNGTPMRQKREAKRDCWYPSLERTSRLTWVAENLNTLMGINKKDPQDHLLNTIFGGTMEH